MLLKSSWLIGCYISNDFYIYAYSQIIDNKKYKFSLKSTLSVLLFSLLNWLAVLYLGNFRIIITILLMFLLLLYVFRKPLIKTIIGTISIYLICALSEMLFSVIFLGLLGFDEQIFCQTPLGIILSNIIIISVSSILINIKVLKKTIVDTFNWYRKNNLIILIIFAFLVIIGFSIYLYQNFMGIISISYFIMTNIVFAILFIIVIGLAKEKTNNGKLTYKYDNLIDYVKTYEKEIVEKGKLQHEYQNQLILIKGMIEDKDETVIKYLEETLNEYSNCRDNCWLEKLSNIPEGGLKGLLHYKISKMLDYDLKIYLNVDKNLKSKRKWKRYTDNQKDISKVIGVYLDNAMEAAKISKNKYLIVEFNYDNGDILISISNTYNGIINPSLIDKEGYSTKGQKRGYGLSLANDIVNKYDFLVRKRIFNGQYFVQQLIIKK